MKKVIALVSGLPLMLALSGFTTRQHPGDQVTLDDYTRHKIEFIETRILKHAGHEQGERIRNISANFLGTPYVAHMLVGSATAPEQLVIDFRGLDCFTYLDYVEALRKSDSLPRFVENLVRTRYADGKVSYTERKHFFTDWAHTQPLNARDVTTQASPRATTVTKILNAQGDGSGGTLIPSVGKVERAITYIPSEWIDDAVVSRLKTGDYIGIYTPAEGLDVTHTGIFIMTDKGPVLRNASAREANHKVVDSPFMDYVKKTPGIVVLRAI
ncbi:MULTISPECIES: DUF1460 domain-containing protein [Pseudomonas]|jgi:hypothetical protein|uniref:DUF1460 domain-containing protein n=1 Tax=Pseudomonas gingeri TaxID=117681 RepID=A0A7Y8BJC2_9PSED|nr:MULTISPECIES: DUF1460 domain-containing protein [Pseudomonas]MCU1739675.1 DUF1460 domain-containing protein [Pseudomonas sp. 20S_6.2_Bac1]NWB45717.1 DUF1460 domain-containing protein [Pseudomonas gingeri]